LRNTVTIRHVAKEAGVAVGTASRVLNGNKSVSEEVRRRVLKAVKKLGYEPDRLAQSMRSGVTHTVACATRDIGIAGLGTLVHAAEEVLRDSGYILLLAGTDERKEREIALLHILSQRRVDALIIATSSETDNDLNSSLAKLKIPIVLLDRETPAEFDAVMLDHFRAVKAAADHLLGLGHRRIALLTGHPSMRPSRERISGFESAMQAVAQAQSIVRTGGFSSEFGFSETLKLLTSGDRPTAIIAGGMSMLGGVLQAIRSMGLSIPGDISVIAGADTELAALATPPVTAVRWSCVDEGRVAVQLLLSRLKGNRYGPVQRILLSTELVKRESTGPAPLRRAHVA
jgi:LacI family transcriptional regulator